MVSRLATLLRAMARRHVRSQDARRLVHPRVVMNHRSHRLTLRAAVALTASLAIATTDARAQSTTSDASALSTLPIAVSVAAPVAILSTGAALTVVAVEATGTGVVWVLERVADGTR